GGDLRRAEHPFRCDEEGRTEDPIVQGGEQEEGSDGLVGVHGGFPRFRGDLLVRSGADGWPLTRARSPWPGTRAREPTPVPQPQAVSKRAPGDPVRRRQDWRASRT